jgi:hypothetical protein
VCALELSIKGKRQEEMKNIGGKKEMKLKNSLFSFRLAYK